MAERGDLQRHGRSRLLVGSGDVRGSHDVKCGGKLSGLLIIPRRQGPPKTFFGTSKTLQAIVIPFIVLAEEI